MLIGILTGILLGGLIPSFGLGIQFLGDVFLQALFALVVPLVVSSMIVGIASLGDVRQLGPLGIRTVLFFMTTTGLAVLVGLILVIVLHPGVPLEQLPGGTAPASPSEISLQMNDK